MAILAPEETMDGEEFIMALAQINAWAKTPILARTPDGHLYALIGILYDRENEANVIELAEDEGISQPTGSTITSN